MIRKGAAEASNQRIYCTEPAAVHNGYLSVLEGKQKERDTRKSSYCRALIRD